MLKKSDFFQKAIKNKRILHQSITYNSKIYKQYS